MSRGGHRYGLPRLPVESCHSLSSWGYFQEAQMWTDAEDKLEFSWEFNDTRAVIRFTRNGRAIVQQLAFVTTHCTLGGVRYWFACPYCGRRVGKVYLPCSLYVNGERIARFLCRHCLPLTYEQRRGDDWYWSLLHRAERIEARWIERKGVHWRTREARTQQYNALVRQADAYADAGFVRLAARFGWV